MLRIRVCILSSNAIKMQDRSIVERNSRISVRADNGAGCPEVIQRYREGRRMVHVYRSERTWRDVQQRLSSRRLL